MQNLIKEIVDMDKKAREITDAAQVEKVNSEKETAQKREQIRQEYLTRARQRIQKNEPIEREAAEKAWTEKAAYYKQLSEKLEKTYRENGSQWVAELVVRVTGE